MALSIETCAAQHIGDRKEQQDRVGLFPHPERKGILLAVLADGMGGHTGGALAAEQVIHAARQNFNSFGPGADPCETLTAAINDGHEGIKLTRYTSEQDPHSTACVLILHSGRCDWAHCGDSRIYHFRNGELVARTVDHSYVGDLVKKGFLTEEQAEKHPNKNVLVSCLGDAEPPRIDHGEASSLQGGDCFLLCSDGLWAYFTNAELGRVLKEYAPRMAAEILINTARERAQGRGDNCSLVILRLVEVAKEEPPKFQRPGTAALKK
ncbi:MAG: serine/threonine-protein phosphatase [Rhodocyclaceae bacterium]|nr:serine/threonine-protein phosphatase [Rhodocyclaceae bacterium]